MLSDRLSTGAALPTVRSCPTLPITSSSRLTKASTGPGAHCLRVYVSFLAVGQVLGLFIARPTERHRVDHPPPQIRVDWRERASPRHDVNAVPERSHQHGVPRWNRMPDDAQFLKAHAGLNESCGVCPAMSVAGRRAPGENLGGPGRDFQSPGSLEDRRFPGRNAYTLVRSASSSVSPARCAIRATSTRSRSPSFRWIAVQ